MLLKNLRFQNHPILGNLFLNFTSLNGKVYQNIILAGENGTGKSLILNEIFRVFKLSDSHGFPISAEFELKEDELDILKEKLGGREKNVTIGDYPLLTILYEFDEEYNRNYFKMSLVCKIR